MSGNVVGWVYDHYPCATAVDRNRKVVLSEVAEAANRDYCEAHPGVAKIAKHWGFDPGTVRRHLKALVTDGWLEVTEEGGGRGKATVFRVCRERGAPRAGLDDANARNPDAIRAHSEGDTRAFSDSAHIPQANSLLEPPAPGSAEPSIKDRARSLTQRVWEARTPKPAQPFVAVCKIAERMLAAGHEDEALYRAMLAVPTISTGWLEGNLNGNGNRSRVPATEAAQEKQTRIDQRFGFTNGANA